MKKSHIKSMLGASIILASIASVQSASFNKTKKIKNVQISSKVKDKTDNQDSISDGSKTERVSR